ncbi:hypothetical protein PVK06_010197 [Gossypium arboreum]|uniref:Sm domain-containing protein n=1 Tax=Gossypium arboreum TaxID=29729 RepID=A0ABR0QPP4_GOSAR|nr:hypothetical protein PVK06_010197 [Gossypium arboreum]
MELVTMEKTLRQARWINHDGGARDKVLYAGKAFGIITVRKMSTTGEKGSATTKTPADFLKSIRGRPVVVKLNSGVDYRGILACLDGYMNIAMEQTEEYVNGQLKNKYGDAFIRGNNVLYISTSKRTLADGA